MPEHHFVLVHGSWHDGSLPPGEFGRHRLLAEKLVEAGRD